MTSSPDPFATGGDAGKSSIVYVVDDDESLRTALRNLFRSVGLDVQVFASPREFLMYSKPDVPSCLVLDVRLQGQSGLAFQTEIAEATGVPLGTVKTRMIRALRRMRELLEVEA